MRHTFQAALLALCATSFVACKNDATAEKPEKGLDASVVNNPASAAGTAEKDLASMPVMTFTDTTHNFGTINEGDAVSYEFDFTNTGKSPLIISSAEGSCGCTVPDYPHDPIIPGGKGTMKVTFNSLGKPGHQEKSVSIVTNDVRGNRKLYITAEVNAKK